MHVLKYNWYKVQKHTRNHQSFKKKLIAQGCISQTTLNCYKFLALQIFLKRLMIPGILIKTVGLVVLIYTLLMQGTNQSTNKEKIYCIKVITGDLQSCQVSNQYPNPHVLVNLGN